MLAFTIANLKMMARSRQATFWALFFPLLLVVVFGLLDLGFLGGGKIAVVDSSNNEASQQLRGSLQNIDLLEFQEDDVSVTEARLRVEAGQWDYLVIIPEGFGGPLSSLSREGGKPASGRPGADPGSPVPVTLLQNNRDPQRNQLMQGVVRNLVAEVQPASLRTDLSLLMETEEVETVEITYFDVVLMGLIGMAIMTNSIISIAVRVSTYRNNAILKRLLVTPLPIWKYFASEIAAHLVLAMFQAVVILVVGVFIFGARIHGNPLWIFAVVPLASLVFLNIGFILSAWAKTPAAASGMGNAIALPMMFVAGTFFPTSMFPWVLPQISEALPLAPMLSALRLVAIEGLPLWEAWPQLAMLGGWAVATALIAIRVFRFS